MRNISNSSSLEPAHQRMFAEGLTGGGIKLKLCNNCNRAGTASAKMAIGRLQYFRNAIKEL